MANVDATEKDDIILKSKEAAKYLKISYSHFKNLMKSGKIPHKRLSARVARFSKKQLDEFMRE
jgi:excisionase family DNA binding protein